MSSPHLSQWSLLTHFPSFSKYFLSAAHARNCAMDRNHTCKSLGARDSKKTVVGQCDRLWWVQRWSGEGPVEAEPRECCLVWVTPRQGHESAQKPARRATSRQREQHVQKLRDKWKGGQGIWELPGRLFLECMCRQFVLILFSTKILRCQFKRTFTALPFCLLTLVDVNAVKFR